MCQQVSERRVDPEQFTTEIFCADPSGFRWRRVHQLRLAHTGGRLIVHTISYAERSAAPKLQAKVAMRSCGILSTAHTVSTDPWA